MPTAKLRIKRSFPRHLYAIGETIGQGPALLGGARLRNFSRLSQSTGNDTQEVDTINANVIDFETELEALESRATRQSTELHPETEVITATAL